MLLNVLNIYLFITAGLTIFFSSCLLSKSKVLYAKFLLLLSIAINIYVYGYSAEIHSAALEQMLFWNYFEYLGIPFVSALWLTVCLMYTQKFYPIRWWIIILIYGIPALTLIFRMTNDLHHFYFVSQTIENIDGHLLLVKGKGIWYYVQSVHSVMMVLASMILYIYNLKSKPEKVRNMVGATFLVVVGMGLNASQPFKMKIDYMVVCLPLTVIIIVIAIIRDDFLEVKALANETIFRQSSDGMMLLDSGMMIADYNLAAKEFFGRENVKLRKVGLRRILSKKPQLFAAVQAAQATWVIKNKQDRQYFEIKTTYIKGKHNSIIGQLKTFYDITELQLLTNNLRIQATFDGLSGVLNRRAFIEQCNKRINAIPDEMFVLYMIDVDFFKSINDTFGHMAGDEVIKSFGELLRKNYRKSDIIGRLGGDEFAVMINAKSHQIAKAQADKLIELSKQLHINGSDCVITISVGFALVDDDCKTMDTLMKRADVALYNSKYSGKNKATMFVEHA